MTDTPAQTQTPSPEKESQIPVLQFVILGALQGLVIYLLTEELDEFRDTNWMRATIMFVLAAPLAYWLTATGPTMLRAGAYALGLAVLLPVLYLLYQWTYGWFDGERDVFAISFLCGLFISYISIPFFRTRFERGQPLTHYPSLFEFAWNLPVLMVVASLFTGIFWLVLWLWAALFELINISFFTDLFQEQIFVFPVTQAAFATAIAIVRLQERIILALRGIAFALIQVLGPILTLATLLWVLSLPFTGLDPLWETWSATTLMLIVAVVAVTFINALIGDTDEAAGSSVLSRGLRLTARLQCVLLPVFIGIAFYAVYLRIDQYGFTVLRIYALIVAGIGAGHALSYAILALTPAWARLVRAFNVALAGVIVLIAIIVQTPLLNAYQLSADSQLNRLRTAAVEPDRFDYGYLRYRLGQAGTDALEVIRTDTSLPNHDDILKQLETLDGTDTYYQWRRLRSGPDNRVVPIAKVIEEYAVVKPDGHELDPDFVKLMDKTSSPIRFCAQTNNNIQPGECFIFAGDMQGDSAPEYIVIRPAYAANFNVAVYYRHDGLWKLFSSSMLMQPDNDGKRADILNSLKTDGLTFVQPPYRIPKIGNTHVPVIPTGEWWQTMNRKADQPPK